MIDQEKMQAILDNFQTILATADPTATKFFSDNPGNFTVWTPIKFVAALSDDEGEDAYWDIQVERNTKIDPDPVVTAIYNALLTARIQFEYEIDVERHENESSYVRHLFSCKAR